MHVKSKHCLVSENRRCPGVWVIFYQHPRLGLISSPPYDDEILLKRAVRIFDSYAPALPDSDWIALRAKKYDAVSNAARRMILKMPTGCGVLVDDRRSIEFSL